MLKRLSKNRQKKTIYLAPESLEAIKGYADRNGLTFSCAIETLALLAVEETFHMGILEWVRAGVRHEIGKQFNRFAKLHAFTAMEAGTAKETASAVMWWTLQERYRDYLDQLRPGQSKSLADFEKFMQLNQDEPDTQILLAALKKRTQGYRYRTVRALRSPVDELQQLLDELDAYVAEEVLDEPETD